MDRLIKSGIPPAKRGGNKRTVTLREVVYAPEIVWRMASRRELQ